MKLLDSYLNEVGKRLPRRSRQDLLAEMRSTLEDMLEDRARQAGSPASEAMLAETLKEYGSPAKVAAAYKPVGYLVGPRLYPTFELVLKIILAVVLGASLLAFGLSLRQVGWAGPEFLNALGKFALQLAGGLISAFGNLVLVFAILERTLPASELGLEDEKWDPAELEKAPDPDRVSVPEQAFSILFIVAGLVIFNIYPQIVGFGFVENGRWSFVPALSQAFFTYLPWINLLAVVQIAHSLYLLRQGAWSTFTRIANVLIEAGGIVLAGVMLGGPSLVDLTAGKLAGTPLAGSSDALINVFGWVPTIILTILIVVQSIEVATTVYKLITTPRQ